MSHDFEPHLHTPENLFKQIQRCFSLSLNACFSAFVAVTCVRKLVVSSNISEVARNGYRAVCSIVAPSTHWKRVSLRDKRCLMMLSSIPRRLSSDVLLAAEPATRRASGEHLLRKAHHTTLGTCPCVPDQWRMNAAHSAPRELVTTRRISHDFQARTETVGDSPRKMFGCAAMIT